MNHEFCLRLPPFSYSPLPGLEAPRKIITSQYNMSKFVDDRLDYCVPFILSHIHKNSCDNALQTPLFIGVNGAQGSGKTTLVSFGADMDAALIPLSFFCIHRGH